MNKQLIHGLFAVMITWVAAIDAAEAGDLALLASVVFGLAAGLCIGALIAANFTEESKSSRRSRTDTFTPTPERSRRRGVLRYAPTKVSAGSALPPR
jgi:hypothetical protein